MTTDYDVTIHDQDDLARIAELEADNRILTAELRGYFQQYGWESTERILKYHGQPREGGES